MAGSTLSEMSASARRLLNGTKNTHRALIGRRLRVMVRSRINALCTTTGEGQEFPEVWDDRNDFQRGCSCVADNPSRGIQEEDAMKWVYYYATQVGDAQELAFESPLREEDLLVNGYRYLRSEKVDRYPWEE